MRDRSKIILAGKTMPEEEIADALCSGKIGVLMGTPAANHLPDSFFWTGVALRVRQLALGAYTSTIGFFQVLFSAFILFFRSMVWRVDDETQN